jgi:hypothetical protein
VAQVVEADPRELRSLEELILSIKLAEMETSLERIRRRTFS